MTGIYKETRLLVLSHKAENTLTTNDQPVKSKAVPLHATQALGGEEV
jgi:hypothetical protein